MTSSVLRAPISINNHFLPSAPIIALGYDFYNPSTNQDETYALLHEYLHFEHYSYWPITAVNYFTRQIKSATTIGQTVTGKLSTPTLKGLNKILVEPQQLPFESNIQLHKIGLDVLLEGAAVLNYKIKPKTELSVYSEKVVRHLSNDAEKNTVHAIGVRLQTEAAKAFICKYAGKLPGITKNELVYFESEISSVIALRTFGYAMLICGFNPARLSWENTKHFILNNFDRVWHTYLFKVNLIFHKVLLEHDFEEFKQILCLVDLAKVGYHTFISLIYPGIINELVRLHGEIGHFFAGPLNNVLKLHEALNRLTLPKYGVPLVRPRWTPVPTFLFYNKTFNSIRLDSDTGSKDVILRFNESITYERDVLYLFAWLVMMFTNSLSDSIDMNEDLCICPVYQWTFNQYHQLGIDDDGVVSDHLDNFCNNGLNYSFEITKLNEQKLSPTKVHCTFQISNPDRRPNCLFHSSLRFLLKGLQAKV